MPPQSYRSEAGNGLKLPPGRTSRQFAAEMMRQRMGQATNGRDFSNVSDSEMLDLIVYSIFPNFYLQGGYFLNTSLFYRYPWNADPEQCLWEVYVLLPTPQNAPRPLPASLHLLQPDQTFADAEELGPFMGPFLDQDLSNMGLGPKGAGCRAHARLKLGSLPGKPNSALSSNARHVSVR